MLKITNLTVELKSDKENFYILRDFSLNIHKGEIFGLAGESGSGKSVLAKCILGLNKHPIYKTKGNILINDIQLNNSNLNTIRGKKVSMIFQNPQSSLNPVITIGKQLIETIKLHNNSISKSDAYNIAISLLKDVEIDMPIERMNCYPHQLSGGMNQRIMIALAIATSPDLLIADEPTTALDVTIQAQIVNLIQKLNKLKNLTILFISHDLALLSLICNNIAILYSGELMEIINVEDLANGKEKHPYTHAFKNCIAKIGHKNELTTIKGFIQKNDFLYNEKCIFADRCSKNIEVCYHMKPTFNNGYKCHNPNI